MVLRSTPCFAKHSARFQSDCTPFMNRRQIKFEILPGFFAVCRLPADAPIPNWSHTGVLTSVTRTADELSIVCPVENVPAEHKSDLRWTCLKLQGPFAFSETGILSSFIDPLARSGIGIFAISTYD